MVNYHVHDGDDRLETATRLARTYASDHRVQSFTDGSNGIVAVGARRLILDIRHGTYDVYDETGVVGKYTDWEAALAKYESVLERSESGVSPSEITAHRDEASSADGSDDETASGDENRDEERSGDGYRNDDHHRFSGERDQ
ncbi:MAG: hypothetical protein ABEI99_10740 [Halobaculum sp.]